MPSRKLEKGEPKLYLVQPNPAPEQALREWGGGEL